MMRVEYMNIEFYHNNFSLIVKTKVNGDKEKFSKLIFSVFKGKLPVKVPETQILLFKELIHFDMQNTLKLKCLIFKLCTITVFNHIFVIV